MEKNEKIEEQLKDLSALDHMLTNKRDMLTKHIESNQSRITILKGELAAPENS